MLTAQAGGAFGRHVRLVVAPREASAAQHEAAGPGAGDPAQEYTGGAAHLPRAVRAALLQYIDLLAHQGNYCNDE